MSPEMVRRRLPFAAVLCLVAILMAELVLSVRRQSQTSDEAYHLRAGYGYWQTQDFGINPEHPPFVKLVASFPLLYFRPQIVPVALNWGGGVIAGRKFLYANDADVLLFIARMAVSLFAISLALFVFEAADEMFGRGPAFIALGLLVFEPNFLAHGPLVTTDVGLACCLFACIYAFYRYLKQPTILRLFECGLATGLVLAVKHSGMLLFPILGLFSLAELLTGRGAGAGAGSGSGVNAEAIHRRALRLALALLTITVLAVAVLWGFYGFRYRARPDGLTMDPPIAELARGLPSQAASLAIQTLARWRALPESYLYGTAMVISTEDRPSFLRGRLYAHGRWFYFPVAFLIKSSLGFLLLLALTPMSKALRQAEVRREVLLLTIPPGLFVALSMTSDLNIGFRHILPALPFLIVLAGAGAWSLVKLDRRWAYVIASLILLHVISSVRAFPNYLTYSNEAWGGPPNTYKVLTDSNVDWGQGLKAVKSYIDQRQITDCWFAYFGTVDPDYYHIPCKLLPTAYGRVLGRQQVPVPQIIQGPVLISASEMSGEFWGPGELNPYAQFLSLQPADNIGGSILVFRGRFDVPMLAAESHAERAFVFAAKDQLAVALAEAREAVRLAPNCIDAQFAFGLVQKQLHLSEPARWALERALFLAQTNYPGFHPSLITFLQKQIKEQ